MGGLPSQANPCCGYRTDSASQMFKRSSMGPPKEGDLSVCINCGTILVYVDPKNNIQRVAKPFDLMNLPSKTIYQLSLLKQSVHDMQRTRKKN
jgi:hypothetical protein